MYMRLQVKIELKDYPICTTKINSKEFAIPILTAI